MADSSNEGIFRTTIPVVMSFPNLFEAKAFMENGKAKGEPKFSANLNFPADSEELKAIKALAAKLARTKWPDKPFFLTTTEGVKITQVVFPFASGDKLADSRKEKGKDDGDYMRGKVVLSTRSKYEPKLAYTDKSKIVDVEGGVVKTAAKSKFYPGVEVLAELNLVPYEGVGKDGKPGVTAYLNMIVSTCRGKRISGGQSPSEAFKGYVGSVSAEDPTAPGAGAALDDEIPY